MSLEEQGEVMSALGKEVLACVPESWDHGTPTIDCDGRAIHYKLKSDGDENTAVISNELRSLCEKLYVIMRNDKQTWTQCVAQFAMKDGKCHYDMNFTYLPTTPAGSPRQSVPVQPPPARKPWWKIW